MEVYGFIYLLIDGTNDNEYVGQTTRTVEARFYQHMHDNLYVDRVIQKHGADLFATAVLKECYSQEELDFWERHFIKYRDTMSPNGYNFTVGGSGTGGENNPFYGKRHTEESLAKMSESHRGNTAWVGRHHTEETKAKLSAARTGKKMSAETRIKMSAAHTGKSHTEETKIKCRLAKLGKPRSAETKAKLSVAHTGKKVSAETRAKLSAAGKGRKKSPEHRAKIGAGNRGKKMTLEARIKIFAAKHAETPYKNLIEEMYSKNLSYTALAKLLNLSRPTVSQKMLGKQNFTVEQIAKLVEIFDKPAEYLMKRDE